jgi:hypothetical protein
MTKTRQTVQALSRAIYMHVDNGTKKNTFVFFGAENVSICQTIKTYRNTDIQLKHFSIPRSGEVINLSESQDQLFSLSQYE